MTTVEPLVHTLPTSVPGVALFSAEFESVVTRLRTQIDEMALGEPFVTFGAPPVIGREIVEKSGYVREFPNLLGSVHNFAGTAAEWRALRSQARPGGDWHGRQEIADVVLTPAACYHVYPRLAGTRVDEPLRFGLEAYCYRHEATSEAGRLRSFRMKELVYIGSPEACQAWRDRWRERIADWLAGLGLDVRTEVATDPFFGPGARLMKASQVQQTLKLEFTAPVAQGRWQAIASANCHKDHFGEVFGITLAGGDLAHTACVAFGLERIALALVHVGAA
ncbi:aminoacyl--tRNA ligase-related protein [Streptomyces mirabilis]|uniref:aminoacyl--tRNA ligase-related protein n=1 Tax=Streptomyces mirabilis TaxID=68239 RepID=UPI0033CA1303